MHLADYLSRSAVGLARTVRSGEATATELLACARARAEQVDPEINAIVRTWYGEAARRAAEGPSGPLGGVPFLYKDLSIAYGGQPMSAGSRFWRGAVAPAHTEISRRYLAAGLVPFGQTNSSELGLACETAPTAFGPTRNPWNLARSSGGSSGGAAAAVAAGIVPAAHATDGGGSIRIPSHCCGVFGLKPSRGRTPFGPLLGEGWNGLSAHHVVSRDVADSALLLDLVHGPSPGDPYAAPAVPEGFASAVGRPEKRYRIAMLTETYDGRPVDPDCVAAVELAARLAADAGHHVEPARPAVDMAALKRATRTLVGANARGALLRRARELGRPWTADDLEPSTIAWAEEAGHLTADDYVAAVLTIHGIGRVLGEFFETWDLLLTPTFAVPAPPIDTVDVREPDFDTYYAKLRSLSEFTSIHNSTGCPACSVPVHWNAEGLPVGAQFAARLGNERALFAIAGQMQEMTRWTDRQRTLLQSATFASSG
ncbi:amidase [Stella sp.]|uniref:amidase n=1 Tax=Stella sp. TaxID=2912054 RepID=UPI0035B3971F